MVAQIDKHYIKTRPGRLWSRLLSYFLFEGRPLTTKGRWINPLIFALLRLQKMLPIEVEPQRPVFILGTGRSGTTILGIVLSMHRHVGFLNEPKAIWASLTNNEDLIGSYHRENARYRLEASDATPEIIRGAHRIYGAYLRTTGCQQVVDKYPEMIFRVPFLKAIFPEARFLFLSRDGWDTCASIEHWSERLGQNIADERHDWWGVNNRKWHYLVDQVVSEHEDLAANLETIRSFSDHRLMAAVEWIVTMREGISLMAAEPECVLHVPYAALCRQPTEMAHQIADFIGLENDPVYLKYARDVLTPPPQKAPFELPVFLHDAFEKTQAMLGHAKQEIP